MSQELTYLQEKTLSCIKNHHKNNPITGVNLALEINLEPRDNGKEGADMRSIINALRTKGHSVCAGGRGYYWPRNYEELNKYIDEFQRRIDEQQKALKGMKLIALKNNEALDDLSTEDLDLKLKQLLRISPLSFNEKDIKRVNDLNAAIKTKQDFIKRATIREYMK